MLFPCSPPLTVCHSSLIPFLKNVFFTTQSLPSFPFLSRFEQYIQQQILNLGDIYICQDILNKGGEGGESRIQMPKNTPSVNHPAKQKKCETAA